MLRLAGRSAIITGATGGIGRAFASAFCAEGARTLLVDREGDALERIGKELRQPTLQVDGTRAGDIGRMLDDVYERWGRLDIVMNNAGVAQAKPLLDITEADWDRILDVNLRACFFVLQAAARRMRDQATMPGSELRGKLVQTASISAYRGAGPLLAHYAASKAGVVSITRTAAQALAPFRITANAICPGVVDTAMWQTLDREWSAAEGWAPGEAWKRRTASIPLGRPATSNDVAAVGVFLASGESDYVTGQAINVDGGLIMGN